MADDQRGEGRFWSFAGPLWGVLGGLGGHSAAHSGQWECVADAPRFCKCRYVPLMLGPVLVLSMRKRLLIPIKWIKGKNEVRHKKVSILTIFFLIYGSQFSSSLPSVGDVAAFRTQFNRAQQLAAKVPSAI